MTDRDTDQTPREYNTALDGPNGSDPVPMGSNIARDDSADAADAGEDTGATGTADRDDLPADDEYMPDDGLS